MNVEITKLPESRVALAIELSATEVAQALDRTYKSLVGRVNVPGFRRGKAPRPVVERLVGREVFLHEATDDAVRWGYRQAIDRENLTPIDEAEIKPAADGEEHVQPGEPFRFEATVAVKPQVQLPDYTTLQVERKQTPVTDDDVSALLQELRARNATLEPTIRSAAVGDVVTMNVVGKVEGKEVLNRDDFDFELVEESPDEPHLVLPGLSANLVGINRGDIQEIALHLPATYSEQEIAGKTLFLRVLTKEIKAKVLPDVNDEFAQSISEHQTLDELKETLRANLEVERKLEADELLVASAIEAVQSRTFVEIPPVLIDEELERMMGNLRENFERAGLGFEAYLQAVGRSETDLRIEMRETAVGNVKTSLVVGAVADAEAIEIGSSEVNAALEALYRRPEFTETERRRLRASNAVRESLRNRLRRQRALERLVGIMTGGETISPEASEAVADQTGASADDAQENLAVEVAG